MKTFVVECGRKLLHMTGACISLLFIVLHLKNVNLVLVSFRLLAGRRVCYMVSPVLLCLMDVVVGVSVLILMTTWLHRLWFVRASVTLCRLILLNCMDSALLMTELLGLWNWCCLVRVPNDARCSRMLGFL